MSQRRYDSNLHTSDVPKLWSRVRLEKLVVHKPVKKFPAVYLTCIHYRSEKSPPLAHLRSQMNPVYFVIHFFFREVGYEE
jgi:hypothetical protein